MGIAVLDHDEIVEALGGDLIPWAHRCHEASLQLVRSGIFSESRVARGFCSRVGSQHSWVVLGDNCYARNAEIVDPTLWSYDPDVEGVWVGSMRDGRHHPHGEGRIWEAGRPSSGGGKIVKLKDQNHLSPAARSFLELLGPLDRSGWMQLVNSPVEGWPAAEIIGAVADTPGLEVLIPIDILGMLTDRNPNGLYR